MRYGLFVFSVALALSMLGGNCQPANVPPPDASDAVAPVPTPTPTPTPPVGDSAAPVTSACLGACATLVKYGCTTGTKIDCAAWATRDLGSGLVPNKVDHKPLTCDVVAKLPSKADAVAVGFVCP